MSPDPKTAKLDSRPLETNETDPNQVTGRPTQSNGIREATLTTDPADPTRKVHPDSVPLAGAPQPSRRDQVMPTAEPVAPPMDETSESDLTVSEAKGSN